MVTVALVAPAAVEIFAAEEVSVILAAVEVEPVPGLLPPPTAPPPPQATNKAARPAPAKYLRNRIFVLSVRLSIRLQPPG
jgi:hypothetical protein